jgi:hypothetical protein
MENSKQNTQQENIPRKINVCIVREITKYIKSVPGTAPVIFNFNVLYLQTL